MSIRDFIEDNKFKVVVVTIGVLLLIVMTTLYFVLGKNNGMDKDSETFDKRLINNTVIKAIDGGAIDEQNEFYDKQVEEGNITKEVRDEYFNFDTVSTNTFWGRYDIGDDKKISVRLNEKIGESDDGVRTYLTILSYRYLINKEDLGHDYSGRPIEGDIYYRVNKPIVVAVKDGTIIDMTSFPESSVVGAKEGKGLDVEDKHLFEEDMIDMDSEAIREAIEGHSHDHDHDHDHNHDHEDHEEHEEHEEHGGEE